MGGVNKNNVLTRLKESFINSGSRFNRDGTLFGASPEEDTNLAEIFSFNGKLLHETYATYLTSGSKPIPNSSKTLFFAKAIKSKTS